MVVTVTLCCPVAAFGAITRLAVICVEVDAVFETVTPVGGFSLPPKRFVPVTVTDTVAPCKPEEGVMLVSAGAGALPAASKAIC